MTEDIIREIEEGFVSTDLLFASTPRALLRRLEKNPTLQKARKNLTPSDVRVYLQRARNVFGSSVASGYKHPGDMALSAYLFLICRSADPEVQEFIRKVADTSFAGFWGANVVARYFAELIPSFTAFPVVSATRMPSSEGQDAVTNYYPILLIHNAIHQNNYRIGVA